MLETSARKPQLAATASPDSRLDAAGLRSVAEAALARPDGGVRRGPFRPERWLNARQRGEARLAAHWFRLTDTVAVWALTLTCMAVAWPEGLLAAPVGTAAPFVVAATATLGLMKSLGLYRFPRGRSVALRLTAVAATALVGGLAGGACALALGTDARLTTVGLIWTGLTAVILYVLHMGWNDIVAARRASGALTPNLVILGATRHAEALIQDALARREVNILGVFDDRLSRSPDSLCGVPVLGSAGDLLNHRMTPYVDRIVLAIDPRAQARVRELTRRLQALPNEVTLLVDPQDAEERGAALDKLAAAPLAPLDGGADPDRRAFNKRIQDLALGSLALVLLAPLMAFVALLVRLDSPGPAFFRQKRHGFNHEEIVVWKFRTMRHEAADATAARQVTSDDERVTRIGKFLRATSLDELPQLLNVVRGEMSLVGPRPHAIGMKTGEIESARLVAEYAARHRIKPGMTGWAAVQGSRGPLHTAADVRRRVQLDIDYIERQSFWLDLWIMAVTVPVLLGDRLAVR